MLAPIAEFVKRYRHEVGKHTLVVGGGMLLQPSGKTPDEIIEQIALQETGTPPPSPSELSAAREALAKWAAAEPDHERRCKLVSQALVGARPSEGHVRLARMIKDGYFSTVFWASPDSLIERALEQQRLEPERDFNLLTVGVDEPEQVRLAIDESTRITLVKVGGDLDRGFLPLSPDEFRRALTPVADCIRHAMRSLLLIVAYSSRDSHFLSLVPADGDRVFWVNRVVPVESRERYDGLRVETPAAARFHAYQPEVTALLARRGSSRNLICREAGAFDQFFGKLHQRLHRHKSRGTEGRKDLTVLPGGPYRYLDHFQPRHADLFHGRERETERLRELATSKPITVLCGPDGVGKSSLLRAGLAAAMVQDEKEHEDRPDWIPVVVDCAGDPGDDVRRAVAGTLHDRGWLTSTTLEAESFVDAMVEATELAQTGLLLLVDGFEHCVVRRGLATRRGFARITSECAKRLGDRWRMCIAMREELLPYLIDLQPLWSDALNSVLRLGRLSESNAIDAILKPGPAFYCYPEPELAEQVAADLDDGGILPAHLQIVMDRLYEERSWGASSITLKMYEHLGGAEPILSECLDYPLSQLGQRDRRTARTILKRLVGSQRTTIPKSLARLVAETRLNRDTTERVLARLIDLRLVRQAGREGQRQYELIHPYLAEHLSSELSENLLEAAKYSDSVARATDDWLHTQVMPPARLLRRLRASRDVMTLSDTEMEAILRAAAVYDIDCEYWLKRVQALGPPRVPVLRHLLHDSDERVRRLAAEGLSHKADEETLSTLVDGLHDRDDTVRERAADTLESHRHKLVDSLRTDEPTKRQRAAHALGIVGTERQVEPLVGALRDGDDEFTDQATRALSQVGGARAENLLLNRLVHETDAPWSVAYALGHLATDPKMLEELETSRNRAPQASLPKIDYAVGRARLTRGEADAAETSLKLALQQVRDPGGRRAIEGALAELDQVRQRASDSDPQDWPMYCGGPAHGSFRRRNLKLPLSVRWTFTTQDSVVSSPAVAEGMAYIGSRDRNLYCVDATTGALNWRLRTRDRIESSPAVAGDLIVIGSQDGTLYCANAGSGRKKWTYAAGAPIRAASCIEGDTVFSATRDGRLLALALQDGTPKWEFAAQSDILASPAVAGEWLVFGSWDRMIRCLHRDSGEQRWERDSGGEVSGAPAIVGQQVYCPSDCGSVYALDLDSGEELWRHQLAPPIRSSPAVTEAAVVIGDGQGRVLTLSLETGEEIWQQQLEDEISSSPAVVGDLVVLGSVDGSLRALNLATGNEEWKHKTAYGIYSSPAVAGDMVYVGMGYYDLWAFANEPETIAPGADADQ
jgi:outer membrane protein assembly factor BamB/HEAT repeat protein